MPIGLSTAALVTAGVGAAGAIGSAVIGANAAEDAAEAQTLAARRAEKTKREMFEKAESRLDPYATLGTSTLPTLKGILGLDGGDPSGITERLENYPGYKFAVGEGMKAISNQQQQFGARNSGNALKAAADYNRNMGYDVFSDYYNKIMGVTGIGLNASTGIANAAMGTGSGIADIQIGAGNAQAAGIMGRANAIASGIGGVSDAITGGVNFMATPYSGGGGWSGTARGILDNA